MNTELNITSHNTTISYGSLVSNTTNKKENAGTIAVNHIELMNKGIGHSHHEIPVNSDCFLGSYTREKNRVNEIATQAMKMAENSTFFDSYQRLSLQQLCTDLDKELQTIQFSPLLYDAKKIVESGLSDLERMQDSLDDIFQNDTAKKMNNMEFFATQNPQIPIFVFDVDGTINTLDQMVAFCVVEEEASAESLMKGLQSSDRVVQALEKSNVKHNSNLAKTLISVADTFSRPIYPKEVVKLMHDLKELEKQGECKLVLMTQSRGDTPGIQLGKLAGIERQLGADFVENTIILRPSRKTRNYSRADKFGEERSVGGWQVLKLATMFVDDSKEPLVETERKRIATNAATPCVFRADTPYNSLEHETSKFPSIHLTIVEADYLMMTARKLLHK